MYIIEMFSFIANESPILEILKKNCANNALNKIGLLRLSLMR